VEIFLTKLLQGTSLHHFASESHRRNYVAYNTGSFPYACCTCNRFWHHVFESKTNSDAMCYCAKPTSVLCWFSH